MINLHNKYTGECIVIGNGPSLADVPLAFLKSFPSFGANKIYLLRNFAPTFFVCVDHDRVVDEEEVAKMPSIKFSSEGRGIKDANYFKTTAAPHFSYDPKVLYEGYSVTYVSLQLAYWMGFTKVLLVGVDFNYKPYDKNEPDPNHFTPEYKGEQYMFSAKNDEKARLAFKMAKIAYEKGKRSIINLTPNSALDAFERGDIQDWMKNENWK